MHPATQQLTLFGFFQVMKLSSPNRLSAPRLIGLGFIAMVWLLFTGWQRIEHRHQCELIRQTLLSQGSTLINAVNSGILSHRWFGPFVQQQLPETLEVLVSAENAIAIAVVVNDDLTHPFVAGDDQQIDLTLPPGRHVRDSLLQIVSEFEMRGDPPMMRGPPGSQTPALVVDQMRTIVVLDRSQSLDQIHRETRNRILIFVLGTLLMFAAGALWQFTVRVVHAEGRARLLTAEARHLSELSQAAAGLAHETRNPLGLIRGWTQRLVEAGLPNREQQQQAEAVLEECDRVTARINQFLAFARPAEIHLESIDAEELVEELQILLQSDLESKSLQLEFRGDAGTNTFLADRGQVRQVMFNLIANAIAFSPQASTIQISLLPSRLNKLRIQVSDQGEGVPDDLVETVFDPYVSRRMGGTGLGLSIVRRIAVAHGWDVGYKTGHGGESIFWIDGIHRGSQKDRVRQPDAASQ